MPHDRILEPDVLVAGGGSAGCVAATAAARCGRSVLLVEEANCLGGTSTTGGVTEWFASVEGLGDILERVRRDLDRAGALFSRVKRPDDGPDRFFNTEMLKIVWQRIIDEAGVDLLYHGSVVDAEVEAGRVRSVDAVSCSRRTEIRPRVAVDCTGEGDLAFLAGAAFEQGHAETGDTLHMSLVFALYDTGAEQTPWLPDGLEAVDSWDDAPGLHVAAPLADGRVYCNMTKIIRRDPTDPFDLTAAEAQARRQLARCLHFLQRTDFPTHALASSGARIGIREGRRVTGDRVLTGEDIVGETCFDSPDGVAVATAQIDFHSLTRQGHAGWRKAVRPYAIPFACMTPKGFANLLTAGKCISGDQTAMSSYRMTPTCCAMGQAAGTAAAMMLEADAADIRDIDVDELRRRLRESGMELDPERHMAFGAGETPDPSGAE